MPLADSNLLATWYRYGVTKLLKILCIRELTIQTTTPPVITTVNPGFYWSDFMRDSSGVALHLENGLRWILARSTEVGSRTLVAGACAGRASHGQYVADCRNQEPAGWISTEEGAKVQRRVYEQTVNVLEKIEPSIGRNV